MGSTHLTLRTQPNKTFFLITIICVLPYQFKFGATDCNSYLLLKKFVVLISSWRRGKRENQLTLFNKHIQTKTM